MRLMVTTVSRLWHLKFYRDQLSMTPATSEWCSEQATWHAGLTQRHTHLKGQGGEGVGGGMWERLMRLALPYLSNICVASTTNWFQNNVKLTIKLCNSNHSAVGRHCFTCWNLSYWVLSPCSPPPHSCAMATASSLRVMAVLLTPVVDVPSKWYIMLLNVVFWTLNCLTPFCQCWCGDDNQLFDKHNWKHHHTHTHTDKRFSSSIKNYKYMYITVFFICI